MRLADTADAASAKEIDVLVDEKKAPREQRYRRRHAANWRHLGRRCPSAAPSLENGIIDMQESITSRYWPLSGIDREAEASRSLCIDEKAMRRPS